VRWRLPPEERLVGITLALEEALIREAWDEADDLFAARDEMFATLPAYAIPREIDDIDARILARLNTGLSEIRREGLNLVQGRRAADAYGRPAAHAALWAA
jgi:hypothetical protein